MALKGASPLATSQTSHTELADRYKFLYFRAYKNDDQMLGQFTPFDPASVLGLDPKDPEHAVQRYVEFTEAARRRHWGPYDLMRLHQTGEELDPALTADEMVTKSISSAGVEFSGVYGTPAAELALRNQIARATAEQLAQMEAVLVRQWGDVGYEGGRIAELVAKYGHEDPAPSTPDPVPTTPHEKPRDGKVYPGGFEYAKFVLMNPSRANWTFEAIWAERNPDGSMIGKYGSPGVFDGHAPNPQTDFPGHTDYSPPGGGYPTKYPFGVSKEMYEKLSPKDKGKTLAEIWANRNADGSVKVKVSGGPGVA